MDIRFICDNHIHGYLNKPFNNFCTMQDNSTDKENKSLHIPRTV